MAWTRLAQFISDAGLQMNALADASEISRRHLYMLRGGECEPTRGVMVRIARACSVFVNRKVRVVELFDLGDDV